MSYALLSTTGDKDYHGTVIGFLEDLEDYEVDGVVMVAITKDGPILHWNATNRDFHAAASAVQSQATILFEEDMNYED